MTKLETDLLDLLREDCRLPLEKQARIAEKYYGGEMPWRESAQMLENAHA